MTFITRNNDGSMWHSGTQPRIDRIQSRVVSNLHGFIFIQNPEHTRYARRSLFVVRLQFEKPRPGVDTADRGLVFRSGSVNSARIREYLIFSSGFSCIRGLCSFNRRKGTSESCRFVCLIMRVEWQI